MFVVLNEGSVFWSGGSILDGFEIVADSGGVLLKVLLDPSNQIQPTQSEEIENPLQIKVIQR